MKGIPIGNRISDMIRHGFYPAQTESHCNRVSLIGSPPNPVKTRAQEVNMTLPLIPIISIVAGILILIVPRVLNYVVAIYLIVIGVVGLARFL